MFLREGICEEEEERGRQGGAGGVPSDKKEEDFFRGMGWEGGIEDDV